MAGAFIFGPVVVGVGLVVKGIILMSDAYALVEVGTGFTGINIAANIMWVTGTVLLLGGVLFSLFWLTVLSALGGMKA